MLHGRRAFARRCSKVSQKRMLARLCLRSQRLHEALFDLMAIAKRKNARDIVGLNGGLNEGLAPAVMQQRSDVLAVFEVGNHRGVSEPAGFGHSYEINACLGMA